ncbi:MAG TPA: hypothetical protein IAD02_03795 [Candidatus Enterousia intestinigallinarum]|jgi:hypothetical protein|uniref:Uncharacterized protein n=1 Tax=Candidatus Enterousia intestinigallinarum TaxID=2840790 RepID=A0A9D1JWL7_9PROT|nr:hypothetical protein [Candidatus Enterousia intestinigallinarum]
MQWKNIFSWEKIRQHFDWTPVAVRGPRPRYETYNDVGRVLLGYEVEVKYLYHGVKKRMFVTDEEKLGLVSRKRALANAISFYKDTKGKILEYKKQKEQQK